MATVDSQMKSSIAALQEKVYKKILFKRNDQTLMTILFIAFMKTTIEMFRAGSLV